MKSILITLLIALTAIMSLIATPDDDKIIWSVKIPQAKKLNFTPDDKYVIAWTNAIEFWDVETGTLNFKVPNVKFGGFSADEKYLVFIQDGEPKLLDWQTRGIIDGFEPTSFEPKRIKIAHDNNLFMCANDDSIVIWNIETKAIEDIFTIETDFLENGNEFIRRISDYSFAGNEDDLLYVSIYEENKLPFNHPEKVERRASLFYNRNDFTLFDSLAWFRTYKFMNENKDILAINYNGGKIDFYNIRKKELLDTVMYENKSIFADDIKFSKNDKIMGIASSINCKLIKLINKEIIQSYNFGVEYISFPNNSDFFAIAGGSFISLRKKLWLISSAESYSLNEKIYLTPNPVSNILTVAYKFINPTEYKLSLFDISGVEVSIIDEGFISNLEYSTNYNISTLPAGSYFIKLEYGEHSISKQFIKE